jgi:ComF family protein
MDEEVAEKEGRGQRLGRWLSGVPRWLADVIAPPRCLSCGDEILAPSALCPACWAKVNFIAEPVCAVLGLPLEFDQGEGAVSGAAIASPPEWDQARGAVVFDDHSRGLTHALKYHDRMEVAGFMAQAMTRAGRKLIGEADVLVPVPLHRWRLWRRRFNQSALLARKIATATERSVDVLNLRRVKRTRSQVGLTQAERAANVARAFAVTDAAAFRDRRVLLIDDVLTTGATANACARALKKAGAARVDVLVFGLVVTPRRPHIIEDKET